MRNLGILLIVTVFLLMSGCSPTPAPPAAAPPTQPPPTAAPEPTAVPPTAATEPTAAPATQAAEPTPIPPTDEPATQAPEPTAEPPTQAEPDGGDVAAGQAAYGPTCGGCHGADAVSGRAPKLAGTALSQEEFVEIVRKGRGGMPAFGEGRISDEDLINIYAWLVSLAE